MTLFVEEENERLDVLLTRRYQGEFSRTYFQNLIEEGLVLLNGERVKKRIKPKIGDEIEVEFVLPKEIELTPENIPLNILYEDDHIIVVNKPSDMVVHPAPGNPHGTFVNALLYHVKQLPETGELRPGIVHRLDKDTTGVLVAAKTYEAHRRLVEAFSERKVGKEYLAVVCGNPGKGELKTFYGRDPKNRQKMAVLEEGGKEAITRWSTQKMKGEFSLVSVELVTGRTHQIRVHMAHLNTPIVGDKIYGSTRVNDKTKAKRQLLHAWKLDLEHPVTGKSMHFEAPIPEEFNFFIDN